MVVITMLTIIIGFFISLVRKFNYQLWLVRLFTLPVKHDSAATAVLHGLNPDGVEVHVAGIGCYGKHTYPGAHACRYGGEP